MSNEIDLYLRLQNPMEAIDRIGEMFQGSRMFGCERIEQGKVLALMCLAEGKSPVYITRTYDIVEGKLRKKALAALAEFRAAGGKHAWKKSGDEPADTDDNRFAELWLKDADGNELIYRYSMADARAEGLVREKSRWVKRPGNMLRARCISNGLGMLTPEIFAGGDDDESEPALAEPLNLSTAQPAKPTPTPKAAKAVVLPADPQKAPVAAPLSAPEPTPPTVPGPVSAPAKPTPVTPQESAATDTPPKPAPAQDKLLPADLAVKVMEIVGNREAVATAWCIKKLWISEGQSLANLTEEKAKKIINNPSGFLIAIGH